MSFADRRHIAIAIASSRLPRGSGSAAARRAATAVIRKGRSTGMGSGTLHGGIRGRRSRCTCRPGPAEVDLCRHHVHVLVLHFAAVGPWLRWPGQRASCGCSWRSPRRHPVRRVERLALYRAPDQQQLYRARYALLIVVALKPCDTLDEAPGAPPNEAGGARERPDWRARKSGSPDLRKRDLKLTGWARSPCASVLSGYLLMNRRGWALHFGQRVRAHHVVLADDLVECEDIGGQRMICCR